ncbi:MAG: helix-turn-helix domain-containing protein, partial [Chlamydiia bacterium]|nr:helix-turn-helix domain-containing protein [Chlamydiia bacterium]
LVNKLLRGDKDKIKNIDISEDINTTDKTDSKHDNSEKPTILLVENNKELSDFITETIEDKFNVITAFNGEDGLRIARDLIPDLIISDIESSETDNVHMWTLIKNDELISHIPIILLSTNIDAESKIESYKQGIDAYISKPFDIEILPARINNLITQRRSLSTDEITENTHPFSAKIVDVINAEYHLTELNVNYLANSMSMSRTNFYRKFIDNFDVSPKDYITKFRINKAIELIENGNENMGNISFMCGFASQSNFSVSFKREKGVTPLKYKKRLTGN